jgi:predicted phage tail protein
MVNIYLYGILAKEFGFFFKLNVSNCFSALKAIDTNKKNFFDRINYLSKSGIDYSIIADGEIIFSKEKFLEKKKIKNIYIIPFVCGFGQAAGTLGNAVATKLGMVAASEAGKQAALTAMGQVVAFLVNTAVQASIQVGISLVMGALMRQAQPPSPGAMNIGAGGNAIIAEASNRSYIFSNPSNIASQGASIPLGYGKTKLASKVVWNTLKNYLTSETFTEQFIISSDVAIFNDYIA